MILMLGLRHAHRRTVPVHVCRRSPAPPLTQPATAGSARPLVSCLTWSLPSRRDDGVVPKASQGWTTPELSARTEWGKVCSVLVL